MKKLKGDANHRTENLIVISVMAVIILTAIFNWNSIEPWFSYPLFWKGQDKVEVCYRGIKPQGEYGPSDTDFLILLEIINNTGENLRECEVISKIEGVKFDSLHNRSVREGPNHVNLVGLEIPITLNSSINMTTVSSEWLTRLRALPADKVNASFRVKYFSTRQGTTVNNTGWLKCILIFLASFFIGAAGWFGNVKTSFVRIPFKIASLPAAVIVVPVLLALTLSSGGGGALSADFRRKRAVNRYNSASIEHASAIARGDTVRAAYAQDDMDRAFADIISDPDSVENSRYKMSAGMRAAAAAKGDTARAAHAQSDMERELVKIIAKNSKK